jgi:tellurite methyltransferase
VRETDSAARRADVDLARAETIRYHQELYASTELGTRGTWLARPHGLVLDAIARVGAARPIVAYDLGAGIGRHVVPMTERLHPDSSIIAVDLLPTALTKLATTVRATSKTTLRTVATDLAEFEFDVPADLVIAFSVIEHLPDLHTITRLLRRVSAALNPGGVVAIGVIADRYEIASDGARRPALLESALTCAEAEAALQEAFGRSTVIRNTRTHVEATESRDGHDYRLASTLLSFMAENTLAR